jgi:uncharacterized protein DUF3300
MKRRSLLTFLLAAAVARVAMAQDEKKTFTPAELDQILAPIALYPDSLLGQVLMATSYPLEIVEAARWSKTNPDGRNQFRSSNRNDRSSDWSHASVNREPWLCSRR